MMRRLSQRGSSIIAAVLTLVTLAILGASVLSVVSEEQGLRGNEWQQSQAFYTAMTGLEYGLQEIANGGYPNAANKPFAGGAFTTQVIPALHLLTVAATAGIAQRNYRIQVNQLAGDCGELDSTGAVPIGSKKDEINRVKVRKICMSKIRIDRFRASWTPASGQKLTRLDFDGDTIYNNPSGVPSGTEVDVTDTVISDGSEHQFSRIVFTATISEVTMTITVTFSDGSAVTTTWDVD